MSIVSSEVLRAGRALLGLSQSALAAAAEISVPTLRRIETDQTGVSVDLVKKVQGILEREGVEFLPETAMAHAGLRKLKNKERV